MRASLFAALITVPLLAPINAHGCACGCGVFEVGDLSMFPPSGGSGIFSLEYDYQSQNRNWSGDSRAPASDNDDKKLRSHVISAGIQYMFNSKWGIQVEVPVVSRSFTNLGGASGESLVTNNWGDLGDIRIEGIYTGFTSDQSLGVTAGLKLPTGNYTHNDAYDDIDRDTEIGTGSTDLLLGGFYHHRVTRDDRWRWFAQVALDLPLFTRDDYCPGYEIDGSVGIYYNAWTIRGVKIRPIAQVIALQHGRDSGANSAQPPASGYQRVLLSPGIEIDMHPIVLNAQVDLPVYERVTGNQLVAPALFKVVLSYRF